jgi:hypothetical protein
VPPNIISFIHTPVVAFFVNRGPHQGSSDLLPFGTSSVLIFDADSLPNLVVHCHTENLVVSNINLLEVMRVRNDIPAGSFGYDSADPSSLDNFTISLDSPDAVLVSDGYVSELSSNLGPLGSLGVAFMDSFSEVHKVIGSADSPDLVSEATLKNLHDNVGMALPASVLVILSSPGLLEEAVGQKISSPDITSWTDGDVFGRDAGWASFPASSHWDVMGYTSSHHAVMSRGHTSDSSSVSNVELD